mmetsp:Transcript_46566/g.152451  ORF Transcript_46566/g.152451 Transcript_46566/m.152451 type:complete len:204 (-) Transcript_46566:1368-1979(-)
MDASSASSSSSPAPTAVATARRAAWRSKRNVSCAWLVAVAPTMRSKKSFFCSLKRSSLTLASSCARVPGVPARSSASQGRRNSKHRSLSSHSTWQRACSASIGIACSRAKRPCCATARARLSLDRSRAAIPFDFASDSSSRASSPSCSRVQSGVSTAGAAPARGGAGGEEAKEAEAAEAAEEAEEAVWPAPSSYSRGSPSAVE